MPKLLTTPDLLMKLQCSICKLYLSIFPIYIRLDGSHPICGRCKVPNDDYIRDEAYEGIARLLHFPCAEDKNGCTEQLIPKELKDHEQCCVLRKLDCPCKRFSLCTWRGPNKDLKAHFDAAHGALVLTERKFEINFLSSSNEILLLPFQDELFLLKKETDTRSGTFVCFCTQIILKENSEKFNYFIRVQTSNSTYHHKFPEQSTEPNWEEPTKFTFDEVKDILHDPPAIVAFIEIVKAAFTERDKVDNAVKVEIPEVDWEALRILECPVCLDYVTAPIYQCINGHSICSHCKPNLEKCPLCRAGIMSTQNFALEKVVERIVYPCKYHKSGCSMALKSSKIKHHEESCVYGPYDCPVGEVDKCQKKFIKSEIMAHVDNDHGEYVLKSDKVNIPFVEGNQDTIERVYLIKFSNRLFKVNFKFDPQNSTFYWTLQLVGPAEDCKNFQFEIDLIDNSGKELRQCARGPCAPLSKNADSFINKKNYILFLYEQISEYIVDSLSYRVRILKDSVC